MSEQKPDKPEGDTSANEAQGDEPPPTWNPERVTRPQEDDEQEE